MRRRQRIPAMWLTTAALLTVGVVAWAQNLTVQGQFNAQGTGVHSFLGNIGIGTTNPASKPTCM